MTSPNSMHNLHERKPSYLSPCQCFFSKLSSEVFCSPLVVTSSSLSQSCACRNTHGGLDRAPGNCLVYSLFQQCIQRLETRLPRRLGRTVTCSTLDVHRFAHAPIFAVLLAAFMPYFLQVKIPTFPTRFKANVTITAPLVDAVSLWIAIVVVRLCPTPAPAVVFDI
jgi:hypothetical protein